MSLDRVLTLKAEGEKEWVAGVWRKDIDTLCQLPENGFVEIGEDKMMEFLEKNMVFRERTDELEKDKSFKQIIPYFVLVNQRGEVYSATRKDKGGDMRLHGQRTIGFGGHLRKEDIKGTLIQWLEREMEEEVKVEIVKSVGFFGLINNDIEEVSASHLGLFFEVWVRGEAEIMEKEKFEEGRFYEVNDLVDLVKEMENWSVVALKNL